VSRERREQAEARFAEETRSVFRETVAEVVAEGLARLEEGEDWGGEFVRLVPHNPRACEITAYLNYPTLCLGREQNCTELFGPEEERLSELRQLVRAVIAGRYEWRHRQVWRLFWPGRYTELVGTFHTDTGPWTFTRMGSEPPAAVAHTTYEPYGPA
jgi:hypothetical protein